jgi:tripartite-type tricarboxylate transporter receptor subunit TctC
MTLIRRSMLYLAAATVTVLAVPGITAAQTYPDRPVRFIVSFPPGSASAAFVLAVHPSLGVGTVADLVKLAKARPCQLNYGSSGNIAAKLVVKAPPDGYTLLSGNSSLSIVPAVFQKLSCDPVKDLTAISMASSYPFALVSHPSLPVRTVKQLVALAKAKPDALTYASAGGGTMSHMQWNGFFAPAKTPQPVVDRLYREIAKAVQQPDVKQRFDAEGATPSGSTPAEFLAFFRSEAGKWAEVAKRSGPRLD